MTKSPSNQNVIIVDGDTIAYRVAAGLGNTGPVTKGMTIIDNIYEHLIERYDTRVGLTYLTGVKNFRRTIPVPKVDKAGVYSTQDYKGNRKDTIPPEFLPHLRKYMIDIFEAVVVDYVEADDALGISHTIVSDLGLTPVIVTNDKDLNQIPGLHFNWVKREEFDISSENATLFFYEQLLTGDLTDNLPGLPGIGKARAKKLLDSPNFDIVKMYEDVYKDRWGGSYLATCQLTSILRNLVEVRNLLPPEGLRELQGSLTNAMSQLVNITGLEFNRHPILTMDLSISSDPF